jgi:hypothetical protein
MFLMGLGLWLTPLANAQDRGMVPTSSPSGNDGPRTYMLVVGVSDFKHLPPENDLQHAASDARSFRGGLEAVWGESLPSNQVRQLVGRDATYVNVKAALNELLSTADEDDTVILFFSTHGVIHGEEGFLYMWDTMPGDQLPFTSLPAVDIVNTVNRTRAAHVLLFTDTCHAGMMGTDSTGAGISSFDAFRVQVSHRSFFNQSSSTITQMSLEGLEYCGGHGAYTCALLNSFGGAPDENKDGDVTLGELQVYMPLAVHRMTNGRQSPVTKGVYDGDYVFFSLKGHTSTQSDERVSLEAQSGAGPARAQASLTPADQRTTPARTPAQSSERRADVPVKDEPNDSSQPVSVSAFDPSEHPEGSPKRLAIGDPAWRRASTTQGWFGRPSSPEGALGASRLPFLSAETPVDPAWLEQMRRHNRRLLIAVPSLLVPVFFIGGPVGIGTGVLGLLTITEYSALLSLHNCRIIAKHAHDASDDPLWSVCRQGALSQTFAHSAVVLTVATGGLAIATSKSDSLGGLVLATGALIVGVGAASTISMSALLAGSQHLNNARLIPGVSTPGTSYLPPDPAQPMWAQAGWSPMGFTVVGTF